MFDRTSLHVALLLWGCIFSLIAALCMFMSKNFDREKRKLLLALLLNSSLLLLSDAFAWEFRGTSGTTAYFIVRISNFLVFFLSDSLLLVYHRYLCLCLFRRRKKFRFIASGWFTELQSQECCWLLYPSFCIITTILMQIIIITEIFCIRFP